MSLQTKVDIRVGVFEKDCARASTLYETLVAEGYTCPAKADLATPLRQPDRRDIAQFIFFELAAKYEALSRDLFLIEVRHRVIDSPKKATLVMGHVDHGADRVGGWGSPKQVQARGQGLFGKVGFFGRLRRNLGDENYNRLVHAHKIRNHIAHAGTQAYRSTLGSLGVPSRSRRGCGPGRLLVDYPSTAKIDDRWFHRFLASYELFATKATKKIVGEDASR